MSEVRLMIREAERDWSGIVQGSAAERAIAAPSADPLSLAELEAALARFEKPRPKRSFFADLSARFCDEPYDAGIVVIDLVARLIVVDSAQSSPGPTGTVGYHDGRRVTETRLRYRLGEPAARQPARHRLTLRGQSLAGPLPGLRSRRGDARSFDAHGDAEPPAAGDRSISSRSTWSWASAIRKGLLKGKTWASSCWRAEDSTRAIWKRTLR